ncbi:similar to synaptobrevin-type protein transport protein [Cyanidioschyzon merolae strain 10D]|jgi:hypothetical protein|uniref:Similar to synaptobrevin-type protein transport protein n=1 Tax=Cyanidioschyzon merolae (strain NIES-3377 / 10D) TaxID=280699 RepID=M1V7K3_CYAM1|nr:similar to synaptobrevin-type protein transport protein [Cyanidioschyzon merolae strain 10D]BAM79839.1 similar to synaptobrevin-type protein transport protein [Cyanidioschyzon merolae strain 10D]|eukprot:XP_005536125.1 similar to synaptobrevin-type protein transport protein [Cyanidioschyzon merolae strain 10D]
MGDAGAPTSSDNVPNLLYCAICRWEDRVVLARYAAPRAGVALAETGASTAAFAETLRRILQSKKIAEHKRLTIEEKQLGMIHYDNDGTCMYVVFCRASYPQRLAFQFLNELRSEFLRTVGSRPEDVASATENSLTKLCRPLMSELCTLYDTPSGLDKMSRIRMQVEEVKGHMQDNIHQVMKNTDDLEQLQTQSEGLRGEASAFHRSAGTVERKYWWKNARMICVLVVLVILIIIAIIVPIIVTRNNNSSSSSG